MSNLLIYNQNYEQLSSHSYEFKKHQKQLIRCCFAILLGVKHKNSLHKEFKYSTYLQNLAYQNNGKHLEK